MEAKLRAALQLIDTGDERPDPASEIARDALNEAKGALLRNVVPHGLARHQQASGNEWVVLTEQEKWGFEDQVHEGEYISVEALLGILEHHYETAQALNETP